MPQSSAASSTDNPGPVPLPARLKTTIERHGSVPNATWPKGASYDVIVQVLLNAAEKIRLATATTLKEYLDSTDAVHPPPPNLHLDAWGREMLSWMPHSDDWLSPVRLVQLVVGDDEAFSFPLFLMPNRVSECIVDPAQWDNTVSDGNRSVSSRYAGLVHICDAFVRALQLPVGQVTIDHANNACKYKVHVPTDFPTSQIEALITIVAQQALKLKGGGVPYSGESGFSREQMPYCAVTLISADDVQHRHILARRIGPKPYAWLMRSLFMEARSSGRYSDDVLDLWQNVDWTEEFGRESNIMNVQVSLNQGHAGERWCLIPLIQNPLDQLLRRENARFQPRWVANGQPDPRPETFPYVFWNLGGKTPHMNIRWLQLSGPTDLRFPGALDDLTGLQAVWTKEIPQVKPRPRPTEVLRPSHPPFAWDAALPQRVLAAYGSNAIDAFVYILNGRALELHDKYIDGYIAALDDDSPPTKRRRTEQASGKDDFPGLIGTDGSPPDCDASITGQGGPTGSGTHVNVKESKTASDKNELRAIEALVTVGIMLLAALYVSAGEDDVSDDGACDDCTSVSAANASARPITTLGKKKQGEIQNWLSNVV